MKRIVTLSLFLLILFTFCYFRLKPIYLQTVPYTFDQGRDFLKAQEIINDRNITFIGPTTGVQGLFHGVWWYYLLTIPYLLSNGNPLSYYYFIFFLQFTSTLVFYFYLKKRFNFLSAIFFLTVAAMSPYLISTSFFPINSILAMPFILLMFYATYELLRQKKPRFVFLIFLSLAFIFEAEIPFGLFLIPASVIALLINKSYRKLLFSAGNLKVALGGFIIPLLPRILFEIKNSFLQTKTIISFFTNPSSTNVTTFKGLFLDRLSLLRGYYSALFNENLAFMNYVGLVIIVFTLILSRSKKTAKRAFLFYYMSLIVIIFILTLFYRNNFFWGNYLEGFSYFFLVLLSTGIYLLSNKKNKIASSGVIILLIVVIAVTIGNIFSEFRVKSQTKKNEGIGAHLETVAYIYKKNKDKNLCVRIYTPPVIPYTYHYLFSYNSRVKKMPYPTQEIIDNQCWYIVEHDDNSERKQQWIDDNISKESRLIHQKKINQNITIQLWEMKNLESSENGDL